MPTLTPVVLAGGSGTRLWPLSREDYPKQLLHLTGARTLLQETVMRLDALPRTGESRLNIEAPVVACHEDLRFLTLSQLEEIDHLPQRILLEPCARNTAPALTVAALMLLTPQSASGGESAVEVSAPNADPIMLVMPADHVIADLARFHRAVVTGARIAAGSHIVTFGIVPTHAETGFGYIHKGRALDEPGRDTDAYSVQAFVEKPDPATAAAYLASGDYLWNSGVFAMRASVWIQAMAEHRPDILSACQQAIAAGSVDGAFFRVGREAFAACPSDSVDYAVMERLPGEAATDAGAKPVTAAVVPLDAGWSDIGSWRALLDLDAAGRDGNVTQGDVFTHATHNSLLIARERLLAVVGIEDTVVVDTPDAVLVVHKDHTQDVRKVVEWLHSSGRGEHKTHRRVYRPWGAFEQLDAGEGYQVKRLTVKPGAALSLQRHRHRAEHWVVVQGEAKVTRDDQVFTLQENESTYIAIGVVHRLENPGKKLLEVIEVQSGDYLGEDDIERLEDRYHRDD